MFVRFTVSVKAGFWISNKLSSTWNTVPQMNYRRQKYPKLCHIETFLCRVTLHNSRHVSANIRYLTMNYKFINPLIRYSSFNFKFSKDMLAYLLKIAYQICCRTQPPSNIDIVKVQKSKVVFVHTGSTYRAMEEQLHAFSTSALDESEWWVSHPGCFNPVANAPDDTEQKAGWVQQRCGRKGKDKICTHYFK